MELELKHLAPYLPYKLELLIESEAGSSEPNIEQLKAIDTEINMVNFGWGNAKELSEIKPLLRPLSQLTEEIEHNGEKFVPMEEIDNYHNFSMLRTGDLKTDPLRYPYTIVEALISWHFDVFGLIEAGLAVELTDKTTK